MATGLGIDIGSESIKIVQAEVSGNRVTVTGALKIPRHATAARPDDLPGDAPGGSEPSSAATFELPLGLGQDLKKAGMRRTGTLGVSGRDVILKYLGCPPMPREKLKMLLDMEIAGKLSSGRSAGADAAPAVTYDWRILNTPSGLGGDMILMAGVCKNQFLFGTNALMKRSGINAENITPACFGLVNAYLRSHEIKPNETVVLVDIGHELLEIAILEESNLYFARSAPGAGKKFTAVVEKVLQIDADRAAEYKHGRARLYPEGAQIPNRQELAFQAGFKEGADAIASAIRSSLMFCRTQVKLPKLDYQRVFISGGGARLNGLREYLEKKTGRPVEMLNVDAGLDLRKLDALSAKCFEGGGSEMAVALGLAVIDGDRRAFHFSLVPETVIKRRTLLRKTIPAAAAGVLLLAGLWPMYKRSDAAVASRDSQAEWFQQQEKKVRSEIAAFNQEKRKNRVFAHTVDYYAREARMGRIYLDLYCSIRALTPPHVTWNFLGPADEHQSGHDAPGLSAWNALEDAKREFVLIGQYEPDAYPGQKINEAWETMRGKLLQVPGVAVAELDPTAETDPNAPKTGSKPLKINIRLSDPEKPVLVNHALPAAPAPVIAPAAKP